jgi:hypothetical protein
MKRELIYKQWCSKRMLTVKGNESSLFTFTGHVSNSTADSACCNLKRFDSIRMYLSLESYILQLFE